MIRAVDKFHQAAAIFVHRFNADGVQ